MCPRAVAGSLRIIDLYTKFRLGRPQLAYSTLELVLSKNFNILWSAKKSFCTLKMWADEGSLTRRLTMKTLRITTVLVLATMVSMSFASQMVKSKLGDLDILAQRGGDKVICTAHFADELTLLKEVEADALVKLADCKGWVAKEKIEKVAKAAGNTSVILENYDINAWLNETGVFVLKDDIEDFEGVTIDRDFREYLTYTIDREQTEMRNGDN